MKLFIVQVGIMMNTVLLLFKPDAAPAPTMRKVWQLQGGEKKKEEKGRSFIEIGQS